MKIFVSFWCSYLSYSDGIRLEVQKSEIMLY